MIDTAQLTTSNPREAAYYALLAYQREELFVQQFLNQWIQAASPKPQDSRLAREIAYGTVRMQLALDHIAASLTPREKLSLKSREKILVRMAIYQFSFMEKIPIYAITNETLEIAKKNCHPSFVKFLNAILRRLPEQEISLPQGRTIPELSIRYSYPTFFVQELIQNHGLEQAIQVMESLNQPSVTMFRIRPGNTVQIQEEEGVELLAGTETAIGVLKQPERLPSIAASNQYYIQNVTPALLIHQLAKECQPPNRILDLCAAPGGKLIAAHDYFPNAQLFANDVSPQKLKTLSENFAKYEIRATLTCSLGEEYPGKEKFDLIILDVPCSNSGVLNKRPEARWRISHAALESLEEEQLRLIKRAVELLEDGGEIWYMTCSILKRENERLIEKACEQFSLTPRLQQSKLPIPHGWDGGFACALRKAP